VKIDRIVAAELVSVVLQYSMFTAACQRRTIIHQDD